MHIPDQADVERDSLARLLFVAEQTLHQVADHPGTGSIEDLETALRSEVARRGDHDASEEWVSRLAASIAAGAQVGLPASREP